MCQWAADRLTPTAAVYSRIDEEPWHKEEATLLPFLLTLLLCEASFAAAYGAAANWLSASECHRLLEDMRELPLGRWRWPAYPTRFFSRGESATIVTPNDDGFTVCVFAQHPRHLSFLLDYDDYEWDWRAY